MAGGSEDWGWSLEDVSALGRAPGVPSDPVSSPSLLRGAEAGVGGTGVDVGGGVGGVVGGRAATTGRLAAALAQAEPVAAQGEAAGLSALCAALSGLRSALDAAKAYGAGVLGDVWPDVGALVPSSADFARVVSAWVAGGGGALTRGDAAEALRGDTGEAALRVAAASAATVAPGVGWGGWADLRDVLGEAGRAAAAAEALLDTVAGLVAREAPNLAAVVGPEVAAGLVVEAGGMRRLACLPSCAVQTLADASGAGAPPRSRTGLVARCPAVAGLPAPLRDRAVRLVSAKAVLAARVDALAAPGSGAGSGSGSSGAGLGAGAGEALAAQVGERLAQWQAPPRRREARAEPIPQPLAVKKRGGRRARKLKEKHALSRAAKRATKVALGVHGASDNGYVQRDGVEADL